MKKEKPQKLCYTTQVFIVTCKWNLEQLKVKAQLFVLTEKWSCITVDASILFEEVDVVGHFQFFHSSVFDSNKYQNPKIYHYQS